MKAAYDPLSDDLYLALDFRDRIDVGAGVMTSRYFDSEDFVIARRPNRAPPDPGETAYPLGGTAEEVATLPYAAKVLASDGGIFLVGRTEIEKCASTGCARGRTSVFSTGGGALSIDSTSLTSDALAVSAWQYSLGGRVSCPWTSTVCDVSRPLMASTRVLVDDNRVFWRASSQLMTCLRSDCSTPTPIGGPLSPIASDGASVVGEQADAIEHGRVALVRCPVNGCAASPSPLVSGLARPMYAVRGPVIVYRDSNATALYGCEVGACTAPTILAATSWGVGVSEAAIDDDFVYFFERSQLSARLVKCPLAGCPAAGPTAVLTYAVAPASIAVDATHVYWTVNNKLYRILK